MFSAKIACALLLVAASAHAEPTTWLSIGGGIGTENHALTGREGAGVFTAALGVGTDPNGKYSIGGLLRSTTYFGIGTELALGPRLATSGFTRGDFGFAFDAGLALRPFGRSDYGRVPFHAGVTVGFPWGLQAEVGARLFDVSGQPSSQGLFVAIGIDVLRFSVHRRGRTEKVWPNPSPAGAVFSAPTPLPGETDGVEDVGPSEKKEDAAPSDRKDGDRKDGDLQLQ